MDSALPGDLMVSIKVVVISGSLNPMSCSRVLVRHTVERLGSVQVDVNFVDLQDVEMTLADGAGGGRTEDVIALGEKIAAAQTVIVSSADLQFRRQCGGEESHRTDRPVVDGQGRRISVCCRWSCKLHVGHPGQQSHDRFSLPHRATFRAPLKRTLVTTGRRRFTWRAKICVIDSTSSARRSCISAGHE